MTLPIHQRLWAAFVLSLIFFRKLCSSAVMIARAALAREMHLSPAIIAVPLDLRTNLGVVTVANLTSVTPGLTSLHTSNDGSILYVHLMDSQKEVDAIENIKGSFEHWVRKVEGWQ